MSSVVVKRTLSRATVVHRMYCFDSVLHSLKSSSKLSSSSFAVINGVSMRRPILLPQIRCITITNEYLKKRQLPLKIKQDIQAEQNAVLEEGAYLSRTLYRNCIRSILSMRHGNDYDELLFKQLEERRKKEEEARFKPGWDPRDNHLVMIPRVDRKNELQSRVNYYMNYLKQHYVQDRMFWEIQALNSGSFGKTDFDRYVERLKRGEHQRTFLLKDMKFPDPVPSSFDKERLKQFKKRAYSFVYYLEKGKKQTKEEEEEELIDGPAARFAHFNEPLVKDKDEEEEEFLRRRRQGSKPTEWHY